MAAVACHGLQSCLESQLAEARIHRLRLPSTKPKPLTPPPPSPQPIDLAFKTCFWEQSMKPHCEGNNYKTDQSSAHNNQGGGGGGGWSFIQALSNVSKEPLDKESTYVHPQVRLSPKSLELCTENLGNETGTDITESSMELLSCDSSECGTREQRGWRQHLGSKKKKKPQNFPPPLTTIRGEESLRVRPHREGGRLVIEVTKAPPSGSCFHAERSDGRLRLCFLEDPVEEEEEEEEAESGQRQEAEEEEEEEETEAYRMVRMGMNNRRRRRTRCKEEGEHDNKDFLINWRESHWVSQLRITS